MATSEASPLGETSLAYYKARMYSPTLGRFMQTDPIGYGDGMNMYAYVGGDPVNRADPSGLYGASRIERFHPSRQNGLELPQSDDTVVTGCRRCAEFVSNVDTIDAFRNSLGTGSSNFGRTEPLECDAECMAIPEIVLTAQMARVLPVVKYLTTKLGPKVVAKFPDDASNLGHIFRKTDGHYPVDTPLARAQINRALKSFSHTDRFGNSVYSAINKNGTQTWAVVRNGVIQNAGINQVPVNMTTKIR